MSNEDLSLEKLKIHDRLLDLEKQMARFVSHMDSEHSNRQRLMDLMDKTFNSLKDFLEKHEKILIGEEGPGALMRLDRLEQSELSRKWHFGVIWTALIGLGMRIVYEFFKG